MANLTGASQLDVNAIPTGSLKVPGVTALKAIQGGAVFTDAGGDDSAPIRAELVGGSKATYTYAINALGVQTAHTDIMIVRGSATKLVKIIRFMCSGAATAATETIWFLKKHTVANTGGSGTTGTATKHDSADGAATAVIQTYQTTLPTIDATATLLQVIRLTLAVAPAATSVNPDRYIQWFGQEGGEPIVLRGIAQEFAFNLGGGTIPTGEVVDFSVTWTEE